MNDAGLKTYEYDDWVVRIDETKKPFVNKNKESENGELNGDVADVVHDTAEGLKAE